MSFPDNKVGSHIFAREVKIPPTTVIGTRRHKAVLVVGILEIIQEQSAAFVGKSACHRLLASHDLQVSAAGIALLDIRNKHKTQSAFGQGIQREVTVFHLGRMFQATDLDNALQGLVTHATRNRRSFLESVLTEVNACTVHLNRNLQSFATEFSFEGVVTVGNAFDYHFTVLVGFGRISLFAIQAFAIHKANPGERSRRFVSC